MNPIKISILMPIYNNEKYLDEAIRSIVNQTFKDFELLLINDASTDNSKKIALEWEAKDNRITVIENKYEKGISGALNSGLEISKGEFIARADADDINEFHRLETQIKFFNNHKDIDIVGTGYQLFGNGSEKKVFHPSESIKLAWKFITNTYFCHPSVMFRSSVLKTIDHYPAIVCEDFAFFSKIIQHHRGKNIPEILIHYRQHSKNYSSMLKNKIELSVMETYKNNFLFFTGSLDNHEIFYKFHAKKDISFRDLFKIIDKSLTISNKIIRSYNFKKISQQSIYLYSLVLLEIKLALTKHYLRKIFK